MKRDNPLNLVNFHCRGCLHRFEAAPETVEDAPQYPGHPWLYLAVCPRCNEQAEQVAWERGLLCVMGKTGPKTPEGKAAATANLDGHPTPEEAKRTRFNAMKHGLYARTANYFPAKPGHYPACNGCEYLENQDCLHGPRACLKRTSLFLRHQVAFETQDPQMLMGLRADTQAAVQGLINDMILSIAQDGGPRIHEIKWYTDKEGDLHLAKWIDTSGQAHQIHEIKAHPLLKPLMEFIAKNGMTLVDLEMTPKARDDQDLLEGYLDHQDDSQETTLKYQGRQTVALEKLQAMIERSQQRLNSDPILIEHSGVAEETGG